MCGPFWTRRDAELDWQPARTPVCLTIDHQTITDNTVTLRDRDTLEQRRVSVGELRGELFKQFGF